MIFFYLNINFNSDLIRHEEKQHASNNLQFHVSLGQLMCAFPIVSTFLELTVHFPAASQNYVGSRGGLSRHWG